MDIYLFICFLWSVFLCDTADFKLNRFDYLPPSNSIVFLNALGVRLADRWFHTDFVTFSLFTDDIS